MGQNVGIMSVAGEEKEVIHSMAEVLRIEVVAYESTRSRRVEILEY